MGVSRDNSGKRIKFYMRLIFFSGRIQVHAYVLDRHFTLLAQSRMQISARTSLIAGYEAELMRDCAAMVRCRSSNLVSEIDSTV